MAATLIGYHTSPFVRKTRVAFAQKGIPYSLDPIVPYTDRDKVLSYNSAGTVPVLLPGDGAAPIPESAEIVAWAERVAPEPALIPTEPEARRRALNAQQFADSRMAQVFGGMMFGQRMIVAYYFKKETGREDAVQRAINDLAPSLLDALAQSLEGRDYIAGAFSVGDIAASSWLRSADIVGYAVDQERWPGVAAWLERCFAQPGYVQAIEEEEALEPVQWARARYGAAR